ncbi:MAG: CbtB-domain containing protein [Acidimicrobiales bacterium]
MDASDTTTAGSVAALPAWTWLVAAFAVALFWLVTMEAGAVSTALGQSGPFLHELFHDGRHLIGVPCH